MAHNNEKPYYVLDLTFTAKARCLAYSGAAGSTAAVAGKVISEPVLWVMNLMIATPEFTSTIIGLIALVHAAKASSEDFSANLITGRDITMRKMRPARFQL